MCIETTRGKKQTIRRARSTCLVHLYIATGWYFGSQLDTGRCLSSATPRMCASHSTLRRTRRRQSALRASAPAPDAGDAPPWVQPAGDSARRRGLAECWQSTRREL